MGNIVIQFGDGSMVRDFIYIDDLVNMITEVVQRPRQHRIYNLGSGTGYSVSQILKEVSKQVVGPLRVEIKPQPPTYVNSVVLDVSRYVQEFGKPELTSLTDGISKTAQELRNQLSRR